MTDGGFSLILPTRGRTEMVDRLLESVLATCRRPERIEVVLYADQDDSRTIAFERSDLRLLKHVGPRVTMGEMIRACYRLSREQTVFVLNDDVIFRTPDWDEKLLTALADHSDGVGLVYGNDLHQGPRLPTFPVMPRTTCELLGEVCQADYARNYIDAHLLDVFRQLRRRGHDRIRYLPGVIFEHMHAEAGKAAPARRGDDRAAEDELIYVTWAQERQYLAYRLAEHIARAGKKAR